MASPFRALPLLMLMGVDAAAFQIFGDLQAVLQGQKAIHGSHLIAAHADENRETGSQLGPDTGDDFCDEAATVLPRSAVSSVLRL